MAGMQAVGWPGVPPNHFYNLRAEPLRWWQRHIPWLPFMKDTKPRFRLTVNCVRPKVAPQELDWFIRFENRDETGAAIKIPAMQKGEQKEYIIGDRLLGIGGDAILGVRIPTKTTGHFHTLVSFWVLRGETVLFGAILALLSGGVGALATFLATR